MLIEPVRELLKRIGKPYVIENVEAAPLQGYSDLFGNHGVVLCGYWKKERLQFIVKCSLYFEGQEAKVNQLGICSSTPSLNPRVVASGEATVYSTSRLTG